LGLTKGPNNHSELKVELSWSRSKID